MEKAFTLEEYMQALLRTGFPRESVLEKGMQYLQFQESYQVDQSENVRRLEEAALVCNIHNDQVRAEVRNEMQRYEKDLSTQLRNQFGRI